MRKQLPRTIQLGDPTLQTRKETLCEPGTGLVRRLLALFLLVSLSPIAVAESVVDADVLRQQPAADLEGDVSSRGWKIKSLRFGVKGIFGPDVKGWGLIIGYGF